MNTKLEFERNEEGSILFKGGPKQHLRILELFTPGNGIVHQVNLEYLAKLVQKVGSNGENICIPDTLVGTDSHTTMINGISVLGWGVGGIEAEAAMLGSPSTFNS